MSMGKRGGSCVAHAARNAGARFPTSTAWTRFATSGARLPPTSSPGLLRDVLADTPDGLVAAGRYEDDVELVQVGRALAGRSLTLVVVPRGWMHSHETLIRSPRAWSGRASGSPRFLSDRRSVPLPKSSSPRFGLPSARHPSTRPPKPTRSASCWVAAWRTPTADGNAANSGAEENRT